MRLRSEHRVSSSKGQSTLKDRWCCDPTISSSSAANSEFPIGHCGVMPSCLMILPHLSASARVNVASSSGLDLAVSTAMSSIRFFTSGRNRIRPSSALSLETISFDMPAGPLSFPKIPSLRFAHERAAEVLAKVLAGDQADEAETLNTFKELLRLRQVAEECANRS